MSEKSNTILNNNITDINKTNHNNNNNNIISKSSIIKPFHSNPTKSKLSETTLNNSSSNLELCQDLDESYNISKSNETIVDPKDSNINILSIKKKNSSKGTITPEETVKIDKPKSSSKKESHTTSESKKKSLKIDRSPYALPKKSSTSKHNISSKSTKQTNNTQLNNSTSSISRSKSKGSLTSLTTKISKNSLQTSLSLENKSMNNNINGNNTNIYYAHSHPSISSSINNLSKNSSKKSTINHKTYSTSQDNINNKKTNHKITNTIKTSLLSNKPLTTPIIKKPLKSDIRKYSLTQNELVNRLERNKPSFDYMYNRNDPQLRLKKNTYIPPDSAINEKEIVLNSNEYRKALAKINSLEKTIKQLQTQHSEILSCLHAEISRLQRACSEKTLSEAFKGTGLLTSLSGNNLYNSVIDKSDSLNSSTNSLDDQDIVIKALNKLPKGMNVLPKIPSTKKPNENNSNELLDNLTKNENNTINLTDINNDNQEIAEKKPNDELKRSNENNISNINLNTNSSNIKNNNSDNGNNNRNEACDLSLTNIKKKTSGNIRAHKYHSIEKSNSLKNSSEFIESNYTKQSLSDSNLTADLKNQHKSSSTKSFVSLSDASTAVALSSGHSSSISSLIKSDIALNRQLPPPLPPNYPKGSGRSSESPRHLINLPKILQPIVKIKENKNTSINLPSLIKNKTSKNSQRY